MTYWIYDISGYPAAILDEYCIRSETGTPIGWIFGISLFSREGVHLGWAEHGVFYDFDNRIAGFVPELAGELAGAPHCLSAPPLPLLKKRPNVPTLRGRNSRPAGGGWSSRLLGDLLAAGSIRLPAYRRRAPRPQDTPAP